MAGQIVIRCVAPAWETLSTCLPVGDDVVVESAALGVGRLFESHGRLVAVLDTVISLTDDDYVMQEAARLRVQDRTLIQVASRVRGRGTFVLLAHSHPGGPGTFSCADDDHERDVAKLIGGVAPGAALVSLLRHPGGWRARIHIGGELRQVATACIVDRPLRIIPTGVGPPQAVDSLWDRHVVALGANHPLDLSAMRSGNAGAGGLGSVLADGAVRMGAGSVVLVDHDHLEDTNVTRVVNSTVADAGRPKPVIARDALDNVFGDPRIIPIHARIEYPAASAALLSCDVVFLATDNHSSRDDGWQIAREGCSLVISVGIDPQRLDADRVQRVSAYVADLLPTDGCPLCNGVIDAGRLRAEALPPTTAENERRDGYIPNVGRPAVLSWNLIAAGEALGRFLELTAGLPPARERGQIRMYELLGSVDQRYRVRAVRRPHSECSCARPSPDRPR